MLAKTIAWITTTTLGLALFAAPAAADYPAAAPVRAFNLPDLSGLTTLNLDVQFTRWRVDLPAPVDEQEITSMTLDLGADFEIAPHWVIVARMPFVYADAENTPVDNVDCCGFGLGNLTLGVRGLFSSIKGDEVRTVVGGEFALSLATASDDGDGAQAAQLATTARIPHDPGRYRPNTWTPRLNGHAQLYSRWFMVQVEAGLHLFLYDSDQTNDDSDLAVRLALAAGVRATTELAFVAELNGMVFASDDEDGDTTDDDTYTSFDVGVRYGGETLVAGLRLYIPLTDRLRDLDMFGVGLDIGARF